MPNHQDNHQEHQAEGMVTVLGLLNVFYRGRRAIIGLTALGMLVGIAYSIFIPRMYQATAQVRPGVVSYTPEGLPMREWALEDVVTWFEGGMYWSTLQNIGPFQEVTGLPRIKASFVPSLTWAGGGNVVTLTNMSSSPELARFTLDGAIVAFNRQALADSLGSSLYLTVRRGRLRVLQLKRDIEQVDAKEDRAALSIEEQRRELTIVELESQGLELDLKGREANIIWMKGAVGTAEIEVVSGQERLLAAEKLLAVAVGVEESGTGSRAGGGSADAVSEVLRQAVTREQAGRVGELLLTVNNISSFVNRRTVWADSLKAEITGSELEIERIRLLQDVSMAKKRADIEQKIKDLEIVIARDLPYERTVLQSELDIERVKVDVISPLERVGVVAASPKPVRPRKLRATLILTILAFFGSIFLVLVREYYGNNRAAIRAPGKHRI